MRSYEGNRLIRIYRLYEQISTVLIRDAADPLFWIPSDPGFSDQAATGSLER